MQQGLAGIAAVGVTQEVGLEGGARAGGIAQHGEVQARHSVEGFILSSGFTVLFVYFVSSKLETMEG